ncbi:MAG: hypothetical protein H6Q41_3855 [Deltaproteobacteria bacterium]|jgi:hypothetical protein|nr:hypothetical protein [Deltaproteobacteria bacterium]
MEKQSRLRGWMETVAKLLPGIGAVIAGILIPLVIQTSGEKSRNHQLYAEIVSRREVSDTELRAKMFENLIKSFFGDGQGKQTNSQKLTLLRLLALNFHEFFNLEPLFDQLESELGTKEEKERLREIAREIVSKQEAMLSQVEEGRVFTETAFEGEQNGIMVPSAEKPAYRGHRLGIKILEIGKSNDYAIAQVEDIPEGRTDIGTIVTIRFKLNYYDTPFIENTKLSNSVRFAITLQHIGTIEDRKIVQMKVIFLPETYMSARDRPYLEEMLRQLIISNKGRDE